LKRKRMSVESAQAVEPARVSIIPAPRLDSLRRVRLELSAVYRDARAGRIPSSEATRLAYVVRQIADLLEVERIEQRLDALEQRAGVK
jgi:hypothetical protein